MFALNVSIDVSLVFIVRKQLSKDEYGTKGVGNLSDWNWKTDSFIDG